MQPRLVISFMFFSIALLAQDIAPNPLFVGKTFAFTYENGKSPKEYDSLAYDVFNKMVENKEITSLRHIPEGEKYGGFYEVYVNDDDSNLAATERNRMAYDAGERFKSLNLPITHTFYAFPKNRFFGDKRITYVVPRYESCLYEPYFTKSIELLGGKLVKPDENPDVTITVGIDACMSAYELNEIVYPKHKVYLDINSINNIAGIPASVNDKQEDKSEKVESNSASVHMLGNDLLRSGSSISLNTPNSGNIGLVVMGAGLALDLVSGMSSSKSSSPERADAVIKPPYGQEVDFIRYHVTFDGKNMQKLSYYQNQTGKTAHTIAHVLSNDAYIYSTNILWLNFSNWIKNDVATSASMKPYNKEPDMYKSIQMMLQGDAYVDTEKKQESDAVQSKGIGVAKPILASSATKPKKNTIQTIKK